MSEQEQLIVGKSGVVVEKMLPLAEWQKNLGTISWPCARVGGKLYAYGFTADRKLAEMFVSRGENANRFVVGIGLEIGEFYKEEGYEEPRLKFYDDMVGVWEEIQDVPEVFRNALGGES